MGVVLFLAVIGAAETVPSVGDLLVSSGGDTWLVEIHVFSGRRDPKFQLSADEVAEVKTALLSVEAVAPQNIAIVESRLGYRGITVTRINSQEVAVMKMEVGRGLVSLAVGGIKTMLYPEQRDVERFFVDLALRKGALSRGVYDWIVQSL